MIGKFNDFNNAKKLSMNEGRTIKLFYKAKTKSPNEFSNKSPHNAIL